jgi:hypothetical protein
LKRIVLPFGLIAGSLLAVMFAINLPLLMNEIIDFEDGEILGYSSMVIAFLAVFFGIRRYRETTGNGAITFGRAFKVGILITLIACAMYVAAWEIIYWSGFGDDFADKYVAFTVQQLRDSGASAAEIATHEARMAEFKELYRNPLINVGLTFLEVFPVGLIMTLVSAAILRRRSPGPQSAATAIA